jgi:hypothetical protein
MMEVAITALSIAVLGLVAGIIILAFRLARPPVEVTTLADRLKVQAEALKKAIKDNPAP